MDFDQNLIEIFDKLYEIIPKSPDLWNEDDISNWLKFLKLENYLNNFKENSVDGYLILEWNEDDLKNELKITTKLHLKKIIKAINILKEYSKYLKEIKFQNNNITVWNNNFEINNNQNLVKNFFNKINETNEEENHKKDIDNINLNKNCKEYLIIKTVEAPYINKHQINKNGSKIGRHSTNDIIICDESVSRYHAVIDYIDNNFKLKDIGSTTGTFIKVIDPIIIEKKMILEIGSYQFLVDELNINENDKNESFLIFSIYESLEEKESEKYVLKGGSTIGRKNNNTIHFQDDMHMSNVHCKINLIGNNFYFEDQASTNGCWIRLSKEGKISNYINIDLDTIFKIGNSAMYQTDVIKLEADIKKEEKIINQHIKCCICWEDERDCFIEPCKHNVSCMKCTKNVKVCPICRILIDDIIKIYKA